MNPQTPHTPDNFTDAEAGAHHLLLRATAPASADVPAATALAHRAQRAGKVRLNRRRAVGALTGAAAAVLAAAALLNLPSGGDDSVRRLVPASPSPASSPVQSGVEVPLVTPGGDHLADLPGSSTFDWRAQVTESLARYPGTFVLPEQLPPGVYSVQANTTDGRPFVDVMEEGPGVTVCALEEATCRDEVAMTWKLLRTAELDGRAVYVFVSPPQLPGTGGIPDAQRRFWETVTFTTGAPDWLSTDD